MVKRVFLFLLTNIAVIATISIVMNVLGIGGYITEQGLNYTSLLIFCGLWGMVGSFISLMMSKWSAKRMMGVQILDPHGPDAGLVNMVARLSNAAGLPKVPEVGIYHSPEVNAFATGPSKRNSLVAVSSGLLQKMNDDELEGVLAHEIAHIANGDMVTMALVQGVVNAFVMFFARIVAFAIDNFLSNDEDGGGLGYFGYMAVTFVLDIAFSILATPIVAGFSRYREYRADAGGAKLAGRDKMIGALQRLQNEFDQGIFNKHEDAAMNSMKITSKEGGLKALMSTHPKLSDRISRLQKGQF